MDERLIHEACSTLEMYWKMAIEAVARPRFTEKMATVTRMPEIRVVAIQPIVLQNTRASSGSIRLGSNTTFIAPLPSSNRSSESN